LFAGGTSVTGPGGSAASPDQVLGQAHSLRCHRIADLGGGDLPFDAGRQLAGLDLPGFVERSGCQATPPPGPGGGLIQPGLANRRTTPIAANVSRTARLSSRWVLSGVRSPACAAIVHPFRRGIGLITAAAYLPACSHVCVRAKHRRSSTRFRRASAAPILAAAAALGFVVLTNT
jgi:hypothetical protein